MHADADSSFELLYRGHRADVFRAALRELGNVHDAEDVTQAAFVDAYRAVLRGTRPESPRAWLLAIAENVRRRSFRTAQRRPREEPLDEDAAIAAENSHEQASALATALAELPGQQREAFVLREIGGLSYDEIAARTGSTVGSVQMLLFRARRTLRNELDAPAASPRRAGVVVPLPGWFAGLGSRMDSLALAPRAAGVAGAAVLAAGGVGSSAASEERMQPPPPSAATPPPAVASSPSAPSVPRPAPAAPGASPAATPAAPRPDPAPVVVPDPPPSPLQPAPIASPQPGAPAPAPESSPPPLVPESTAPPVLTLVPVAPAAPEPSLPASPTVPSQLEEAVEDAGAAGPAGADAPPLPLPALDSLPPLP